MKATVSTIERMADSGSNEFDSTVGAEAMVQSDTAAEGGSISVDGWAGGVTLRNQCSFKV